MIARVTSMLVFCLCAVAMALPAGASAAQLANEYAYGLSTAQLDGSTLYWLQASYEFQDDGGWSSRSRLLRRDLSANVPEVAFEADGDERITAFNAVGGRLVVGLYNPHDESSKIIEVTRSSPAPATAVVVQRSGDYSGLMCSSRVRLLAINAQSEIVIEELRRMSRDGNCADGLLKRTESTISAIAPGGAARVLLESKAGWDNDSSDTGTGRMRWGGGDWFLRSPGQSSNSYSFSAFDGGGMLNLATGQFAGSQLPHNEYERVEIATDGRALVNRDGLATLLYTDPLNPDQARRLRRTRTIRWLHFCDGKLLEISRRGSTQTSRSSRSRRSRSRKNTEGNFWNLYILNLDGVRERRLTKRLPRGTNFDACDAGVAVFHKSQRRGGARQFTVPLTPPAA